MASRSDQAPSTIKIEDLLAREEIHDTLKRYVRAADRADAELMVSCYHKDGYDDHGSFRGSASDFANFVCGATGGKKLKGAYPNMTCSNPGEDSARQ